MAAGQRSALASPPLRRGGALAHRLQARPPAAGKCAAPSLAPTVSGAAQSESSLRAGKFPSRSRAGSSRRRVGGGGGGGDAGGGHGSRRVAAAASKQDAGHRGTSGVPRPVIFNILASARAPGPEPFKFNLRSVQTGIRSCMPKSSSSAMLFHCLARDLSNLNQWAKCWLPRIGGWLVSRSS